MRVILINLQRAADRRQKMTAQFTEQHVPFEILNATDGKSLTDQDRALINHEARRAITPYPLTDNEIGCWLSHKRAIESIASGPDLMGVVVEDDTQLFPDFNRVLKAIEEQEPRFDFLFLHRNFKKGEIFEVCRDLLPAYAIGRVGYTHMGCHAYVVSREGARRFLKRGPQFAHAVDKEIHRYWANGLDIYGLETPVALHADEGHSYIDETRGHDRPLDRERYADANELKWRVRRSLTRLIDSVHKRFAFRPYVAAGRQP